VNGLPKMIALSPLQELDLSHEFLDHLTDDVSARQIPLDDPVLNEIPFPVIPS
jgi:hypothetical protein